MAYRSAEHVPHTMGGFGFVHLDEPSYELGLGEQVLNAVDVAALHDDIKAAVEEGVVDVAVPARPWHVFEQTGMCTLFLFKTNFEVNS